MKMSVFVVLSLAGGLLVSCSGKVESASGGAGASVGGQSGHTTGGAGVGGSASGGSSVGGSTAGHSGGAGGSSGSGGSAGVGGGGGGVAGQTSTPRVGSCSGDGDCAGGAHCLPIPGEPDGYYTCVGNTPAPATGPSSNPEEDECTNSSGCKSGCGCYLQREAYPGFVHPSNRCFCDECKSDDDCPVPAQQICAPAGAWGVPKNTCLEASCKVSSDCKAEPGGVCDVYYDKCSAMQPKPFGMKHCRYPSDPCKVDEDCSGGKQCLPSFDGQQGFKCDFLACPG